jgi:hypothetical protein
VPNRNHPGKPGESTSLFSFASIPYRDYRFRIDDKDLPSKGMFSFLMFIFTLTETSEKEGTPIVAIPLSQA